MSGVPSYPPTFRTREFLLDQIKTSMKFFNPEKCIDTEGGGYFHFYDEDGSLGDKTTRVLVTEARFIFTYAVGFEHLGDERFKAAVKHGVDSLRDPKKFRNESNGAYFWKLKDGKPTDTKILTYALSFVLLAYSKAVQCGFEEAKEYMEETWQLMESKIWDAEHGLYAEEADENWVVSDYRSQSGNLHTCEAMIAAYEATKDKKYLDRAVLIADNICNRQAGLCKGLIWEHYTKDWAPDFDFKLDSEDADKVIFRPWGYQPGHQVEWARFLLTLNKYQPEAWYLPKARFLFDLSIQCAEDPEHGGLAYSFDPFSAENPTGTPCDWGKIFWVQNESLGTAAMLGSVTGLEEYWEYYDREWKYCWKFFVDHQYGSWRRRCNREGVPNFTEKTQDPMCVDPDYHILGGFDGALKFMAMAEESSATIPEGKPDRGCC